MLRTKTLAYGDGNTEISKPKMVKKLGFSGIALLLAVTANCATAGALPRDRAVARPEPAAAQAPAARRAPLPPLRSDCMPDMEPIRVRTGERRMETVCRGGREFVMTDSSLYIRTRENEREIEDGREIRLQAHITITDIRDYAERGIVDWEPTEDSVAILTRSDRTLTVIPDSEMGETVPVYRMPFDVSGVTRERMAYHRGHLFIAPPQGDALVMSFGQNEGSRLIPLRSSLPDAVFFRKGERLFFGRGGAAESEVVVRGPLVDDVSVVPAQKK